MNWQTYFRKIYELWWLKAKYNFLQGIGRNVFGEGYSYDTSYRRTLPGIHQELQLYSSTIHKCMSTTMLAYVSHHNKVGWPLKLWRQINSLMVYQLFNHGRCTTAYSTLQFSSVQDWVMKEQNRMLFFVCLLAFQERVRPVILKWLCSLNWSYLSGQPALWKSQPLYEIRPIRTLKRSAIASN